MPYIPFHHPNFFAIVLHAFCLIRDEVKTDFEETPICIHVKVLVKDFKIYNLNKALSNLDGISYLTTRYKLQNLKIANLKLKPLFSLYHVFD